MSEENAPKLRLKPKLGPDVIAPTPQAVTPDATLSGHAVSSVSNPPEPLVPPATAEAPKFVRLKPRLSPQPSPDVSSVEEKTVVTPTSVEPLTPVESTPPITPKDSTAATAAAEKPVVKFTLRPKGAAPAVAPVAPTSVAPAVVPEADAVNAQSCEVAPTADTLPPTVAAFPPPTKKFPAPAAKEAAVEPNAKPSSKKGVLVGALMGLLVGGAYFGYSTFMSEPPAEAPAPRVAANPVTAQGQAVAKAQAVVNQVAQNATAVDAQTSAPESAATKSGPPVVEATPATIEAPAVAVESLATPALPTPAPAPVPVASVQFRAWVDNLRIGAVLGGATPKVFIGGTAYLVGELVNPQLGIVFDGYDAQTRILTFKDRTGASLEKRN
jgi:hypothetical protein